MAIKSDVFPQFKDQTPCYSDLNTARPWYVFEKAAGLNPLKFETLLQYKIRAAAESLDFGVRSLPRRHQRQP